MVEVEASPPDLNDKASPPHHTMTMVSILNSIRFFILVPCEGEYATGKRKDQDICEPEGSRKKKKKPESCHKKAASDAWKLMDPEEKAKYSTRAREVWDKYLSSAPARAPRPRRQCENGHIACASCCIKVAHKCPLCCCPIGYNRCRAMEKVLESAKVSCVNKRYGCKEILSYSKKTDHESACMYVPCSCPVHGCDFVGTSTELYAHLSDKHASSAEHIFFNAVHPIYIEKHQRYQILQMRTEGILFIINHACDRVVSAINIICVEPAMQKRRFSCKLVVTDGESSFKLESIAESIPNWSEYIPLKKFLLVPRYVVSSSALLKLDVFTEEKESICSCGAT